MSGAVKTLTSLLTSKHNGDTSDLVRVAEYYDLTHEQTNTATHLFHAGDRHDSVSISAHNSSVSAGEVKRFTEYLFLHSSAARDDCTQAARKDGNLRKSLETLSRLMESKQNARAVTGH